MQFLAATLAVASLFSTTFASPHALPDRPVLAKRQVPSKACSHQTGGVHIIAVPGEGSADPPYGLIGSLVDKLMSAIPGSSNISLPYNHSETNGLKQTGDATTTLNTWLAQYVNACPNTKIVLVGYSAGAITVLNSLCGEGPQYPSPQSPHLDGAKYGPRVIAAVAYGDETRTAGQVYNRGTCKNGVGLHPRPEPGATCGYGWNKRIHSYCDRDDPMCCVGGKGTQTTEAHYAYPDRYDQKAVNFVLNQLKNPTYGGT